MLFAILVACVFALAAIICYASCCAAARADRQSEEYFRLKIQETDMQRKIEDDREEIR